MRHVGAADAVVQRVKHGAVRAVDGEESTLDVRPLGGGEVGHVGVGVLQPRGRAVYFYNNTRTFARIKRRFLNEVTTVFFFFLFLFLFSFSLYRS